MAKSAAYFDVIRTSLWCGFIALVFWSLNAGAEGPEVRAQSKPRSPNFKHSLFMEYHSWFENLTYRPNSGGETDVKTLNYGFAVLWDVTQYLKSWGWGMQAGLGQGYGFGESDSVGYTANRIPWTYLRAGGRVFIRLNPRLDLGASLVGWSRKASWPEDSGKLLPGPNPFFSFAADLRWRLSRRWEILQSLGNTSKNSGSSLRFGLGYTF